MILVIKIFGRLKILSSRIIVFGVYLRMEGGSLLLGVVCCNLMVRMK